MNIKRITIFVLCCFTAFFFCMTSETVPQAKKENKTGAKSKTGESKNSKTAAASKAGSSSKSKDKKKTAAKKTKGGYEVIEFDELSKDPEKYSKRKIYYEGILEKREGFYVLLNRDFHEMVVLSEGDSKDLKAYKMNNKLKTRFAKVKGVFYYMNESAGDEVQEPEFMKYKLKADKLEFLSDYEFYTSYGFKYLNFEDLSSRLKKSDGKMLMLDGNYKIGESEFLMDNGKCRITINALVETVKSFKSAEDDERSVYKARAFCRFHYISGSSEEPEAFKASIDVYRMELRGIE